MNAFQNKLAFPGISPMLRLNRVLEETGGYRYASHAIREALTPLTQLGAGMGATVLAMIGARNPTGSLKDHVGEALVEDAKRRGLLTPGKELLEPTSGNIGVAMARAAAARGIPLTLVTPNRITQERRRLLISFGVKLILTDSALGMQGAITRAETLAAIYPERYVLTHQFRNPVNAQVHEDITGPEIWKATGGKVDILVAGVGTGGTITGIARYFKQRRRAPLEAVAVEPAASPALTRFLRGKPPLPVAHDIPGIGAGFVPEVLDLSLIDRVEQVSSEEATTFTTRLEQEEGILAGRSSGAAIAVALRLAQRPENAGKTLVVVLPDAGERETFSPLFNGRFESGSARDPLANILARHLSTQRAEPNR